LEDVSFNKSSKIFFAAADIQALPGGHIGVWIEEISDKNLDKAESKLSRNDIDAIAESIINNDPSEISEFAKFNKDQVAMLTADEYVANHADELEPHSKILLEINCAEHVMRYIEYPRGQEWKIGFFRLRRAVDARST